MTRSQTISAFASLALLVTSLTSTASAEPLVEGRDAVDLRSSPTRVDPWEDTRHVDLRIRLSLPSLLSAEHDDGDASSLVRHVTLRMPAQGGVRVRYRGVHGVIVKHLRRRYAKLWRNQMGELEDETTITQAALRAHHQRMADAVADMRAGGRWWDRSWRASLTPALGGDPREVLEREVGERITILRAGPLSLTNELRGRLDRVGELFFDTDLDRVHRELSDVAPVRDHARLLRVEGDEPAPIERVEEHDEDLLGPVAAGLEVAPPALHERTGVRVDLRLRPELRVRLKSNLTPDARVGVRCVFEFRLGAREQHVVNVIARVRYRPSTQEAVASLQVALLTW